MPPKLTLAQVNKNIKAVRNDCICVYYNGATSKESLFLDFKYGEFTGRYMDIMALQKNHPLRTKQKQSLGAKDSIRREKIIQTNLKKYGGPSPFHNIKVQEKAKQTQKEIYGVDNISQHPDIKEKKKKTCLQNYGVENPSQNQDIVNKKIATFKKLGIIKYTSFSVQRLRQTNAYKKFKEECFKLWGKECEKCGANKDLCIHHINNFSNNPGIRFEPGNGCILCKECHILFHKIYGKENNNNEQLHNFMQSRIKLNKTGDRNV